MTETPKMTDEKFNEIVLEVHEDLLNAPEEERDYFLLAPLNGISLTSYHHTLGRHIRNKYDLWSFKHEPELIDGVDHSPYHPDNISGKIIEEVWKLGNERTV